MALLSSRPAKPCLMAGWTSLPSPPLPSSVCNPPACYLSFVLRLVHGLAKCSMVAASLKKEVKKRKEESSCPNPYSSISAELLCGSSWCNPCSPFPDLLRCFVFLLIARSGVWPRLSVTLELCWYANNIVCCASCQAAKQAGLWSDYNSPATQCLSGISFYYYYYNKIFSF